MTDPDKRLTDPDRTDKRLTLDSLLDPEKLLAGVTDEQIVAVERSANEGGTQYDWARIMNLSSVEFMLMMHSPACRHFTRFIERMQTRASVAIIDVALREHLNPDTPVNPELFATLLRLHGADVGKT